MHNLVHRLYTGIGLVIEKILVLPEQIPSWNSSSVTTDESIVARHIRFVKRLVTQLAPVLR